MRGWPPPASGWPRPCPGVPSVLETAAHLILQAGLEHAPAGLASATGTDGYLAVQERIPAAGDFDPRAWAARTRGWLARGLAAGQIDACRAWLDMGVRLTGILQGLPGYPARPEVWQIGDVCFWHPGLGEGGIWQRKIVDRYATDLRVAILHAELANGADPVTLARNDPGREAIVGLLRHQRIFCNNTGAGEWAYPAIDGSMVPPDLVSIYHVPPGVTEIVLASDGYPCLLPTLAASEERLAELLASDPLCIGPLRGTKAVAPGNISFDDRAYLRLAL